MEAKKVMNWIYVVAGIWLAGYLAGRFVGHVTSPDWSDPDLVRGYAAKHILLVHGKNGEDVFQFPCDAGGVEYAIQTEDVRLIGKERNFLDGKVVRRGLKEEDIVIGVMAVGVPKFIAVPAVVEQLGHVEGRGVVAIALVGGVIGFGIGIRHGYEASPDCKARSTTDALQDLGFWRWLVSHSRQAHFIRPFRNLGETRDPVRSEAARYRRHSLGRAMQL